MKKLILPLLILFSVSAVSLPYVTDILAEDDQKTEAKDSQGKDDEKVDSVWGGLQYTGRKIAYGGKTAGHGIKKGGKAMGRGFKKAGGSIKKFFVGD